MDVFAQAGGGQTVIMKSYNATVVGGVLKIDFSAIGPGGVRHPIINAIEVLDGSQENKHGVSQQSQDNLTGSLVESVMGDKLEPEFINKITIVPNPAQYKVHVLLSDVSLTILQCTIYDTGGRMIMKTDSKESRILPGNYEYHISNLSNGVYVMEIMTSDGEISRQKLIINK